MKKIGLGSLLLLFSFTLSAADGEYPVSKIPVALLKWANAVVRTEDVRFELKNEQEAVYISRYVITILNSNGDKWADFYEYYDRHRQIEAAEGMLYDASGRQLKRVKKKDMEDLSAVSDANLIDDNRIKHHNFYHKVYPYTVEYNVEIKYKSTLFFPNWVPRGGELLSVQQSAITYVCPQAYQLRYKAFLYDKQPEVTTVKNNKEYKWQIADLPAIEREPFSPMWHELSPMLIFGPTEFAVEGYKGNMATWQDFGKFVNSLKAGRDVLPANIKLTVHSIADGIKNPAEKVTRLYEYMQKNTRYISIQLGIGGWQPFEATDVAGKGYGDCKALTNYMYSLLKEAGIPSYYAVIKAGANANYITHDFPSQQFNHVILCVPLPGKDSMWLECTSQTMPAGYLGDFTADRYALLIDDSGGQLVRTPKYGINENLQNRQIKARLGSDATLTLSAHTQYRAMQQDDIHGMINALSPEKVKERLHQQLNFPTFDITDFKYQESGGILPQISESLQITVSNYASITGKRLFIVPNIMTRSGRKLNADSVRKYDILLSYAYRDTDSVEIELPDGYQTESLPQPVAINSPFGNYQSSIRVKDNKMYYYRNMEHFAGRFPAADYPALVKFYETIYKADRAKVVLVKKEG